MVYKKNYRDFFDIITEKKLKFLAESKAGYYHLTSRDGIVFYETYVIKDGGLDQVDFELNHLPNAVKADEDSSLGVVSLNNSLFSKAYTNVVVIAKNDCGDPLQIKSTHKGKDVQLITITYDSDGDFESATVSDL